MYLEGDFAHAQPIREIDIVHLSRVRENDAATQLGAVHFS
jgi:hypothetical protein